MNGGLIPRLTLVSIQDRDFFVSVQRTLEEEMPTMITILTSEPNPGAMLRAYNVTYALRRIGTSKKWSLVSVNMNTAPENPNIHEQNLRTTIELLKSKVDQMSDIELDSTPKEHWTYDLTSSDPNVKFSVYGPLGQGN